MVNRVDKSKTLFKRKIWILASSLDELDFFWAQIAQPGRDTQRVQRGDSILRQGEFSAELSDKRISLEWIGTTFTQGFPQRLEKLYPGSDHIFIGPIDTNNQQFRRDALKDIFEDIANVNKRRIKDIRLLWLTYPNANEETQLFKDQIRDWFTNYLENLNLTEIPIIEHDLPIYPEQRFVRQLVEILTSITESEQEEIVKAISFPLRPLFRIQPHLEDILSHPRVIILELEQAIPTEPIKVQSINEPLLQDSEKDKCFICGDNLKLHHKVCKRCHFAFCYRCLNLIEKTDSESSDFCLGSIYHGLHKSILIAHNN